MANLSANATNLKYQVRGSYSGIVTNGTQLYAGALVCLLSTGYVGNWDDNAASVFLGVNEVDVIGNTSVTPPVEARVNTAGVTLMHLSALGGTPTQAKVGDPVYSADGNPASLTLTIGALNHPIGYLSRYRSATDCDVTLFTPAEMLAQREA